MKPWWYWPLQVLGLAYILLVALLPNAAWWLR
jgi:hypothetical protein